MTKTRYDFQYLKTFCEKNNIVLLDDYSYIPVNCNTKIYAKCINQYCTNSFNKGFRKLVANKNFGCNICSKNIRKKRVENTCINKFGCKNSFQSQEVKDKIKVTNLERYGSECALQNEEVKEKRKITNLERYGVEYPIQSVIVKNKINSIILDKYGVQNISQLEDIKNKKKQTCFKNYGVENPMCVNGIKERLKTTNLEKYGVEYPMQNTEVSDQSSKNAYKSYDYTFPSGRVERIQGCEKYMLDELLYIENIPENNIIVKRSEVPICWYEDEEGNKHRYFVDCFIPSQNRCIEAKSTWTAEKKKDNIFLKQNALQDAGYICEIWVYNSKGEKVECYK